jgi:hypothetical protein
MARFFRRLTGAAMLNASIYEDVESDASATIQAMGVVLLSSLAAGVGALGARANQPIALATFSLIALAVWAAWALLTFEIGTWLLPSPQTRATPGELLRTIGFATAPGILRIAGIVPAIRTAVFAVTAVWMLAAMIVAVRQALDYTNTGRAVAVCAVGWALTFGVAMVIGLVYGPALY